MEVFKNKWFWIATLIVLPYLSISILYRFFNFVIFDYPFLIKSHLTGLNQKREDITIGSYGDMYGGLNAFVSGLAFLGLLITIGVQLWLYYRQEQSKKEEKIEVAFNKLIYLDFLVNQSLFEIEAFKVGINDLKRDNSLEKKKAVFFTEGNTFEYNKVNHINNKIDQEVFFTAYFHKYNKTDVIDLFVSFGKLVKSRQSFIEKLRGYKVECDSELFKLRRAFNILQEKENIASENFKDPKKNGESVASNTLESRQLESINSPEIDILKDINAGNSQFEIYYTIKHKYESQIKDDVQLQVKEYDDYIENCKKHIERIESIKKDTVELCEKQITDITNHEGDIKKVKIRES